MTDIMCLNAYGGDITVMEFLEGQGYNTLFEINEVENIEQDPNQNVIPINNYIIQNPINTNHRIIEDYIPECIEEDEFFDEEFLERNILDIPINHWDPDSYFVDFLNRHYAALKIQAGWREYSLYR